jgi:hypothetical protein
VEQYTLNNSLSPAVNRLYTSKRPFSAHHPTTTAALDRAAVYLVLRRLHLRGGPEYGRVLQSVPVPAQHDAPGAHLAQQHLYPSPGGGAYDQLAVVEGRDDSCRVVSKTPKVWDK